MRLVLHVRSANVVTGTLFNMSINISDFIPARHAGTYRGAGAPGRPGSSLKPGRGACRFFSCLISDEILKVEEPCGFFFYLISDEIRYTKKYIILKSHWSFR